MSDDVIEALAVISMMSSDGIMAQLGCRPIEAVELKRVASNLLAPLIKEAEPT